MKMFLAAFRFFLQPLLLSFVLFPTNVNFVPCFALPSFAAFYTPLSTPFPLFLSRPLSAPALPDHISSNSGFRHPLLRCSPCPRFVTTAEPGLEELPEVLPGDEPQLFDDQLLGDSAARCRHRGFHSHGGTPLSLDGWFHGKSH